MTECFGPQQATQHPPQLCESHLDRENMTELQPKPVGLKTERQRFCFISSEVTTISEASLPTISRRFSKRAQNLVHFHSPNLIQFLDLSNILRLDLSLPVMKSFWRNLLLALSCFLLGYGIHWYRSLDSGRFSLLIGAFQKTVEAEKFYHVVPVLNSYEEYVGREIVLDAFYIKQFNVDCVAGEAAYADTEIITTIDQASCLYFLNNGTRVDPSAMAENAAPAWVRGIIHHGSYLSTDCLTSGTIYPDTTYLQINAVVFHPDVKLREGMRELYGPSPATNMK